MKIALFKNTVFDYTGVWDKSPLSDGWVQISGWVDIDFPPLSDAEKKLADDLLALGKRQQTFEADFRRQRKALEEERAALLKTGT
jgi:hypothetical protein